MLRRSAQATLKLCEKHYAACQLQQKRTTLIFKRLFPVNKVEDLAVVEQRGDNQKVFEPFVYVMLENTLERKPENMDVILTTDIDEFGVEGEIVSVDKDIARKYLLPLRMAVYTSPENLAKYEKIRAEMASVRKQTKTGQRTVKQLAAMTLPIPMNSNKDWILSRQHVRIAFRKVGANLAENAIILPEKPVTEMGEIQIQVKVNDIDTVPVKAVLYPHTKDTQYPQEFEIWKDTYVPLEKIIEQTYIKLNGKKPPTGEIM